MLHQFEHRLARQRTERMAYGIVIPEAAENTPEAHEGLADETGIEIDNAIERPKD